MHDLTCGVTLPTAQAKHKCCTLVGALSHSGTAAVYSGTVVPPTVKERWMWSSPRKWQAVWWYQYLTDALSSCPIKSPYLPFSKTQWCVHCLYCSVAQHISAFPLGQPSSQGIWLCNFCNSVSVSLMIRQKEASRWVWGAEYLESWLLKLV